MAYFNSHLVLSLYRKSNIAEVCQRRGDKRIIAEEFSITLRSIDVNTSN